MGFPGATGRMRSKIASSAGTSAKVKSQQRSIPTPPMNPKWRKPRLAARTSMPNETLDAAEASSVAWAAVGAASTHAASSATPARRSCRTRAR